MVTQDAAALDQVPPNHLSQGQNSSEGKDYIGVIWDPCQGLQGFIYGVLTMTHLTVFDTSLAC